VIYKWFDGLSENNLSGGIIDGEREVYRNARKSYSILAKCYISG
jgi:hypothetical protein